MVGLTAAPPTVRSMLSRRVGLVGALFAAHAVQAAAIAPPVISSIPAAALAAAIGFRGTCVGISVLTVSLGEAIAPSNPTRLIGLLTGAFGVEHIVGPGLARELAAREGNFTLALGFASRRGCRSERRR